MKPETIFHAALAIKNLPERRAFVVGACLDSPNLRAEIEMLLRSHNASDSFLEGSLFDSTKADTDHSENEDPTESQIGPYKLLEAIGEGGMGTVYMAEQTEPVKRRVALKLIKTGMDTRQVIARFEAERQTLALMDHPNIAKVLDAGATDSGRPYFVMELVKGVPINKFCDKHQLTTKDRLQLFQQVCRGVHHAHQKGIIHRDLKPTNVLVAMYDDQPVPKIIDFGVAKATAEKLTEKTMFTRFGQVIGTLEYMSPEQASFNQLDIDTRSDIYSLGAILYELLTGQPPFKAERIKNAALDETLRMIREETVTKPSTMVSAAASLPKIASDRQISPEKLSPLIRGDLDWIVMKALEKDRARRYEAASGFASDVEQFLNDEPVSAGPPTIAYRLKKFVLRNRRQLAMASLLLLILVTATSVIAWMANDRNSANTLADLQATRANEESIRAAKAEQNAKIEADIAKVVMLALERNFDDSLPESKRNKTYHDQGRIDEAIRVLEEVVDINTLELGSEDPKTITSNYILAQMNTRAGRNGNAEKMFKELLPIIRSSSIRYESARVGTVEGLAHVLEKLDRFDEALDLYNEEWEILQQELGDDHALTLFALGRLAKGFRWQGNHEKARSLLERKVAIQVELCGNSPRDMEKATELGETLHAIAHLLFEQQDYPGAESFWKKALEVQRRVEELSPNDPNNLAKLGGSLSNIAQLSLMSSSSRENVKQKLSLEDCLTMLDEAEGKLLRVLAKNAAHGDAQEFLTMVRQNRVLCLRNLGNRDLKRERHSQAEKYLREAWSVGKDDLGLGNKFTKSAGQNLASLFHRQHRFDEKATVLEALVGQYPDDLVLKTNLAGSLCNAGIIAREAGNSKECIEFFQLALANVDFVLRREPNNQNARQFRKNTLLPLAYELLESDDYEQAIVHFQRTIDFASEQVDAQSGDVDDVADLGALHATCGQAYELLEQYDDAIIHYEKANELYRIVLSRDTDNARAREFIGGLLERSVPVYLQLDRPFDALAAKEQMLTTEPELAKQPLYSLQRACLLAVTKQYKSAIEHADAVCLEPAEDLPWVLAASVYSLAAKAALEDQRLSEEERTLAVDKFGGRAVGLLQRAVETRYASPDKRKELHEELHEDEYFQILLDRTDYQRLFSKK